MSMNSQEEYSFSELFKCPVVQSNILNGKFKKIYPTNKLEDSGLIQFLIENTTNHFLDLSQSYPDIKFNVVNSHGSNLAANAKAGLLNYSIASLFQEVYVFLNSNLISSSTNTCTYRAMLKILSGYDQGAKNSHLILWVSTARAQQRKWIWWQWMVLTVGSKQHHSILKKGN